MSLFQPDPSTFTTLKSTPKTILITGGASGIGLATATLLSTLLPSHNLILLDLQRPSPTFPHSPSRTLFLQCNVTSWASQRAAFQAAHEKFGRIDAVFANAGIAEYEDQFFGEEIDREGELKEPDTRTLRVDLDGVVFSTKLAIHYLKKNGEDGGQIVLTASLAGYLGFGFSPLYTAAKHGVVGLTRSLKGELAKCNISVSCVAPGITVTPLLVASASAPTNRTPEAYAKQIASKGMAINRVESVALAVCFLLNQGMKANGEGIFVQNDKFCDLERGLAKSRASWMTKEMLDDYRGMRKGNDVWDPPAKAKI